MEEEIVCIVYLEYQKEPMESTMLDSIYNRFNALYNTKNLRIVLISLISSTVKTFFKSDEDVRKENFELINSFLEFHCKKIKNLDINNQIITEKKIAINTLASSISEVCKKYSNIDNFFMQYNQKSNLNIMDFQSILKDFNINIVIFSEFLSKLKLYF